VAIPEACGLWIEQRVQEELDNKKDTGASLRSIGISITKEISEMFIVPVTDKIESATGLKPYYAAAIISHAIAPCVSKEDRKETGYVYFVAAGDLVKIGWAINPVDRLKQIQHISPIKLNLIKYFSGDRSVESSLHKKFAAYRKRGEWFIKSKEIEDYIEHVGGING